MSSLRNASKHGRKTYKERGQLEARSKLGFLEKKKDYKLRAKREKKKQKLLKVLKRKALDRNPDEFYFHMVNSKVEGGVHYEDEKPEEFTKDQLKLMQTQDLNYINSKRIAELQKIERLKANHHLLDVTGLPKNKHVFYVDSKEELKDFDVAKRLDTDPKLLNRKYNRLRTKTLTETVIPETCASGSFKKMAGSEYKLLASRIKREKQLLILAEKIAVKKSLQGRDGVKKLVKRGTESSAPVYKWLPERKK